MRWCLLIAMSLLSLQAWAACEETTPELEAMDAGELALSGPGGDSVGIEVRVADDYRERAVGFQHVCPEMIERTAIYFVFSHPRRPNFHMRNVHAPLDIAFIDEDGMIVDIQRMKPYVLGAEEHPTYGVPGPVRAALETRAGYFDDRGIKAGSWTVRRVR